MSRAEVDGTRMLLSDPSSFTSFMSAHLNKKKTKMNSSTSVQPQEPATDKPKSTSGESGD
jgi:hypothetical protein